MKTYDVLIERDGGGWMASVPSVPGAHTQGRTIDQARRRIREALGLWVSDAERANLRVEVKLPVTIRRQVERTVALREEAEDRNRDAAIALLRAVGRLTWSLQLALMLGVGAAIYLGASHLMGLDTIRQLMPARKKPSR